ncbi:MAG: hypothetical protein MHMPM18_000749 [Marteilia pararefringens]
MDSNDYIEKLIAFFSIDFGKVAQKVSRSIKNDLNNLMTLIVEGDNSIDEVNEELEIREEKLGLVTRSIELHQRLDDLSPEDIQSLNRLTESILEKTRAKKSKILRRIKKSNGVKVKTEPESASSEKESKEDMVMIEQLKSATKSRKKSRDSQ